MFGCCSGLSSLDVSNFDTSNVTNMSSLFEYCGGLKYLDISHFDTGKVTDMSYMFQYCSGLSSLDVSNFDTRKVTNMGSMFSDCYDLSCLDVSNFDTSSVTDMSWMFHYCLGLNSLDVSNFDTSNVTDMGYMFSLCFGITSLDISNFDTSNVMIMNNMFQYCELINIYVSELWNTSNVTTGNDIFKACTKLMGGNGTIYHSSFTDYTYARIDGGTDAPGYLTDVNGGLYMSKGLLYTTESDGNLSVSEVSVINEKVEIPSTMTIGKQEHTVTEISAEAFKGNTSIVEVVIPETIEGIGTGAFAGCSGLEAIYCYADEPIALGSGKAKVRTRADGEEKPASTVFAGVDKETCILYVPKNSGEKYQYADGWSEFQNIVEMESTIQGDANGDGFVDNNDIDIISRYIMTGETDGFIFKNADTNEDGKVNVADIVEIVNIIEQER